MPLTAARVVVPVMAALTVFSVSVILFVAAGTVAPSTSATRTVTVFIVAPTVVAWGCTPQISWVAAVPGLEIVKGLDRVLVSPDAAP